MASTNMSSAQAQNYLVDPLIAPEPSEETGLNSTFRSTFAPKTPSVNSSAADVTHPPVGSTTPPSKRHSRGPPTTSPPVAANGTRSRGNSLNQRYPGDMSHRPLDMIKKDSKVAHRSHHLHRTSIPGVDAIDSLDTTPGGQYHHEGPFDATLAARNVNSKYSPVAAVADSNHKTLEATPAENIQDAVRHHRPLDGVAVVPPGMTDRYGRTYDYEETNVMTDAGGDYNKVNGMDLNRYQKKEHDLNQTHEVAYHGHGEASGIELQDQNNRPKKSVEIQENEVNEAEHSSTRHSLDGLKKRIGSLRRKKD